MNESHTRNFNQITNIFLFKVCDAKIDILDPELRKQLTLTTADLRFAENLVKSSTDNQGDQLFDETGVCSI